MLNGKIRHYGQNDCNDNVGMRPSSSILAKKREKRKPQPDDPPETNLKRVKRSLKITVLNPHSLQSIVMEALIILAKNYSTTFEAIYKLIRKRYCLKFPYARQKIQKIITSLVSANYIIKDGARLRFGFKPGKLSNMKYHSMPTIRKRRRKNEDKLQNDQ